MRHPFAHILLICAQPLVASCVRAPTYREPIGVETATVTVKTLAADSYNIGLVSYKGRDYLESEGDTIANFNTKMPGQEKISKITFKITANELFRFSLKTGAGAFVDSRNILMSACMTHNSFIPKPRHEYYIVHGTNPGGCYVLAYELDDHGVKKLLSNLNKHKWCLDPRLTGGFEEAICKPSFSYD